MSGYFLYHSIGTFPGKAAAVSTALTAFSQVWCAENDGQWPAALAARQRFMDAWAGLIGAPAGSLTTAENVTAALYSLIGGLPKTALSGRRFLIAEDCFPSLHFMLAKIAGRFGFVLDTVPLRPGEKWVRDDDMLARWQDDVGVALLTFVTSTASHRCDIGRLAQHGRRMGTIVGADITQGVGVAPFSLTANNVDFVVSTSLKWLCGTSGAGILQVRPELLADCEPELRGWFSQENPFSWDLNRFSYASDARRFDHGTPAILASVASLPGLEWAIGTGVDAIAAQNAALTSLIVEQSLENGWSLGSPLDQGRRGGSVMLSLPETIDAARLVSVLREQSLYCDARGSTLRLSPGFATSRSNVDELCHSLKRMIQ
ncbi:aminotransferase class V-fold PLP-dependent enzyme [Phyllobacterium sp. 22229]|uniref:Aminotransferase n=1 Tax=Phyllobacterium myrsinacearum TaxID=28101 RepID=A0A2S9JFU1_9HYPH|nr:aminotransferase class V-fold PLP-dependent enzyme [Phyllobacterium myrsinacearum]PRD51791.1 aminotransferase [Phyllobacterium myrsinacearum]PWV83634.1 selenocysteine lyase/cysteine desulfurase [Phyllobacterium myrsinacearum]RZV00084.1 selenocysteine lyase/cysteine desulfurase [Phyllobacterium myrsinacearum]